MQYYSPYNKILPCKFIKRAWCNGTTGCRSSAVFQKRDFSSEGGKQYRKVNAALKKALGPSDLAKGNAEIKKVAGLRAKLAKAEQHLREATVPAKAEKARDKQSEEVEALKAELRAAEKAIRNSLSYFESRRYR